MACMARGGMATWRMQLGRARQCGTCGCRRGGNVVRAAAGGAATGPAQLEGARDVAHMAGRGVTRWGHVRIVVVVSNKGRVYLDNFLLNVALSSAVFQS